MATGLEHSEKKNFNPNACHLIFILKVAVYSLLMNYSYEAFYCYWAESLLLAQISMMYNESAPKIMSCSKITGVHRSIRCILWLV